MAIRVIAEASRRAPKQCGRQPVVMAAVEEGKECGGPSVEYEVSSWIATHHSRRPAAALEHRTQTPEDMRIRWSQSPRGARWKRSDLLLTSAKWRMRALGGRARGVKVAAP